MVLATRNAMVFPNKYSYQSRLQVALLITGRGTFTIEEKGQDHCGLSNDMKTSRRIINGKETLPHQYPWMVRIYHSGDICGGILVSRSHVLTAGHCVTMPKDRNNPGKGQKVNVVDLIKYFEVFLGAHSAPYYTADFFERDFLIEAGILVRAALDEIRLFPHHQNIDLLCTMSKTPPRTKHKVQSNDFHEIALMFLKRPVTVDYFKDVICLPDRLSQGVSYNKAKLIGWGYTNQMPFYLDFLQETTVDLVRPPPIKCKTEKANKDFPVENLVLANHYEVDSDPGFCSGDSGGPMFIQDADKHFVVGVISGSIPNGTRINGGLCEPYELNLAVKIEPHLDWIKKQLN